MKTNRSKKTSDLLRQALLETRQEDWDRLEQECQTLPSQTVRRSRNSGFSHSFQALRWLAAACLLLLAGWFAFLLSPGSLSPISQSGVTPPQPLVAALPQTADFQEAEAEKEAPLAGAPDADWDLDAPANQPANEEALPRANPEQDSSLPRSRERSAGEPDSSAGEPESAEASELKVSSPDSSETDVPALLFDIQCFPGILLVIGLLALSCFLLYRLHKSRKETSQNGQ